ncbi:MAG: hypothetical protein JWR50_954, partial [Mucilaginibacter sp.]|nr:hypothetical protein [Mucilaginibacter sp.]
MVILDHARQKDTPGEAVRQFSII